jgi:hypothetical protein
LKIHRIILSSLIIIGFPLVKIGLSYAQASEVIQGLAQERAIEKKPIFKIEEEVQVNKQDEVREEKVLKEVKPEEGKNNQVIQKPRSYSDEPRQVKKADTLDRELKDWLDKLKAIESNPL